MPKGVEVQFFNAADSNVGALTDVQVAWLDVAEVKNATEFRGIASAMTLDSSGWLKVDLDNVTGLAVGQDGFLIVYKKNVTDHQDSLIFASKMTVASISAGTPLPPVSPWVRPSDWLALPTLSPGDQKFVGLLAIHETSNFVALTANGNFTVNWGDGAGDTNVSAGVTAEKNIAWADISSGTLTSEGFRQAIVTVTMQAGQTMTSFNLQRKHSQSGLPTTPNVRWLDCAINAASMTALTVVGSSVVVNMANLKSFSLVENAVTSFVSMFSGCRSLVALPVFNCATGTDFTNMFQICSSLQTVPLLDLGAALNVTSMFSSCSALRSVPLLNTALVTNFSSMFASCQLLQTIPLLNTASGTNFSSAFNSCSSLLAMPLINLAAGTTFASMFGSCSALKSVPLFNTAAGLDFSAMFTSCASLETVPLFNTALGTNFSSMLSFCRALTSVPLLNTAAGTNFASMFNNCVSLQSLPQLNTAAMTSAANMVGSCLSLSKARFAGTTRSISYLGLMLSSAALDDIYTGLGTAAGAQTITVTGNWGTTGDDPTIATAKGWTVTG